MRAFRVIVIAATFVTWMPVQAADEVPVPPAVPSVVFGEVGWAGSSVSAADEWLELRSLSAELVDLSGWQVWRTTDAGLDLMLTIPDGQLAPGGTFLVANNGPDHTFSNGPSALAVDPDLIESAVSLSNSTLGLELRDPSGTVVDRAGDGTAPLAGSTSPVAAMDRILSPLGDGLLAASWVGATVSIGFDLGQPDLGTPTTSGRPALTTGDCQLVWSPGQATQTVAFGASDPNGAADITSVTVVDDGQLLTTELVANSGTTVEIRTIISRPPLFGLRRLTVTVRDASGLSRTSDLVCTDLQAGGTILISEVFPAPASGDEEFVELINAGSEPISLLGWSFDDVDTGGSKAYAIEYPLVVPAGGLVVLRASESKLALNNDGDTIQLVDPLGSRIDRVDYAKAQSGQSWSRGQPWYWSTPSPGTANNQPPPIPGPVRPQGGSPTEDIILERTLAAVITERSVLAGRTIQTIGTVTVPQGRYHDRRLIVADDSAAVELQLPEGLTSSLTAGDRIEVTGRVSSSAAPRLLVSRLEDLRSLGRQPAEPIDLGPDQPVQLFQLVRVRGVAESRSGGSGLKLGQRSVRLSRRSGVDLPTLSAGDTVEVLGLVVATEPVLVRILSAGDVAVTKPAETKPDEDVPPASEAPPAPTATRRQSTRTPVPPTRPVIKAAVVEVIKDKMIAFVESLDNSRTSLEGVAATVVNRHGVVLGQPTPFTLAITLASLVSILVLLTDAGLVYLYEQRYPG